MPNHASWWSWAVIAGCLLAGNLGAAWGHPTAMVLSALQALILAWRLRSWSAFPVQVRVGYAVCLVLYALVPVLLWIPTLGTLALLVFGYCPLARILSLVPWNRSEPLTARMVWRTFTAAPIPGEVRHGLPGGCRCELERQAAH